MALLGTFFPREIRACVADATHTYAMHLAYAHGASRP
jgi:hypothetical protein